MTVGLKNDVPPMPAPLRILAVPLRIIILDDVPEARNCHKVMLGGWFKQATLLECVDGDACWQELSRADPDLLITDYNHPGLACEEMLQRLLARKIKYPIIISSAFVGSFPKVEQRIREVTDSRLNIHFLHKSFLVEDYRKILEAEFGVLPGRRTS